MLFMSKMLTTSKIRKGKVITMIEKLIEELDGRAEVIEVECGTLICNELGIPEYMVFPEEGVINDGEDNQE